MTVTIGKTKIPDGVIIVSAFIIIFSIIILLAIDAESKHIHTDVYKDGTVISKDSVGGGMGNVRDVCLFEADDGERFKESDGCYLLAVGDRVSIHRHDKYDLTIKLLEKEK